MNPVNEFEKYAVKHRGISSNTLNDYNKYMAGGMAPNVVTNLTPNIIEERPMNVAVMDVYSRLMMDRIIFLGYPINEEVANIITAQLLFLDSSFFHKRAVLPYEGRGGSLSNGYVRELNDGHAFFTAVDEGGGSYDLPIGMVAEATAAAERGAGYATQRSYDFRLAVFMCKELFAGFSGTIAAAVADHDNGLATF